MQGQPTVTEYNDGVVLAVFEDTGDYYAHRHWPSHDGNAKHTHGTKGRVYRHEHNGGCEPHQHEPAQEQGE